MSARGFLAAVQWGFLGYFIVLNLIYLGLAFIALHGLRRYMRGASAAERVYSHLQMPVSMIVPAYNEEATIATSVKALLQLRYQHFEVIVVNDGSKDGTLEVLKREFRLQPFPEAYRVQIRSQPVRGIYRSLTHPNLRVIDKENGGGKADAINAGMNSARYPIVYAGDADSVLDPHSLEHVVRPFLEDPRTVACGGTVRIVNGCTVRGGVIEKVALPRNPLALVQVVEYLRAFLGGRLGWSAVNGLLIVSGAFGVFHRDTVLEAGGFRADVIGEDMELIVRLHRTLSARGARYRITFVPDPVCWTDAPEDLGTLARQRKRWHRGLAESLAANRSLCFARGSGAAGWLAFPYFVVFELLSPVIEVGGLLVMGAAFALGMMSGTGFLAFVAAAFALGVMLSATAILLEELSFHTYPKARHVLLLFLVSVLENFGYRQVISFWRLQALVAWLAGRPVHWGAMKRKADWQA
ncbi:MAG: glycosyltransferase family 2 protein [Steroidobacteraceae bacterium]|nr:glycosyltransferase family 2 protein [Steroidobacteraceae bacterium]